MFTGEYLHSFDKKGRVIIPAKFREELGETFYIGKGMDKCLFVYPEKTWNEFSEKLKKLSVLSSEHRYFSRIFLSGFIECTVDKQGRILLSCGLIDYSDLKEEAIIIGVLDRLEIWSKENWNIYNSNEKMNFETISEKMSELGFDF